MNSRLRDLKNMQEETGFLAVQHGARGILILKERSLMNLKTT